MIAAAGARLFIARKHGHGGIVFIGPADGTPRRSPGFIGGLFFDPGYSLQRTIFGGSIAHALAAARPSARVIRRAGVVPGIGIYGDRGARRVLPFYKNGSIRALGSELRDFIKINLSLAAIFRADGERFFCVGCKYFFMCAL